MKDRLSPDRAAVPETDAGFSSTWNWLKRQVGLGESEKAAEAKAAKVEASQDPAHPYVESRPRVADGRAHPQQPARRREVRRRPIRRWPPTVANALREGVHRAEPRVQVHRRRRKRPTGSAQRLGEQRKQVEASEQALQRYREQTRRGLARGAAEHRRAEAGRPERGGHARQDRADPEGGALQPDSRPSRATAARSTRFPADPVERLHPAAEDRARPTCSASRRSSSEKLGDRHPDMVKIALGDPDRRGEDPGRDRARSCSRCRTTTRQALAQEQSLASALDAAEGRRARAEPQGHRLRRAAARGRQQPPDLRQPDAADQGDRHLRRAEDEQHPRRRRRRSAAMARSCHADRRT